MKNIRQLLHENVLKTNLIDFQINLLDRIDEVTEANKWCLFESIRGSGTFYLLSAYAYEKAFLYPGIRISIVGSSFKQAKLITDCIAKFSKESKIGLHTNHINEARIEVGKSSILARPIDDGSKICGIRSHILIFPDFISIPKDKFETIVSGFAITESSLPQKIIIAQCDDVDLELYEGYIKYRRSAINQESLIKIKREDFPEGWLNDK